jgi:hypothetical protein
MTGISSALEEAIGLELLILLFVARRAYLMYQGMRYSVGRLVAGMVLYVLLLALTLFETYAVFPWYVTVGELAVVPVAAFVVLGHSSRTVVFTTTADGAKKFRLPITLVVVYIALFVARLVVEVTVFPTLLTSGVAPAPGSTSFTDLALLAAVGVLFAVSTGLLVGRGLGVIRAAERTPASGTSSG